MKSHSIIKPFAIPLVILAVLLLGGTSVVAHADVNSSSSSSSSSDSTAFVIINTPGESNPTCSLSFSPSTVVQGQTATLSWNSQNAEQGSISDIGPVGAPSGSVTVDNISDAGTYTYYGVFVNSVGTANCQASVTVTAPAPPQPTCTLSISPASVTLGQTATLTWDSTDATHGSISDIGPVGVGSGSVVLDNLDQAGTYTYYGVFTNSSGTANCQNSVTVTQVVVPPPAPTCTLTVNPSSIQQGEQTTLSWTSQNASSGSISGIGSVGPSGSMAAWPPQTQTYVGTFTGSGGTVNCSATVTVTNLPPPPLAPTCTLTANPSAIQNGQTATLSWTSANATSGSINNGIGAINASGSQVVTPSQSTTYIATFTGAGGSVNCTASVTVNSVPVTPAPTCLINASPTVINQQGQNITLNWNAQNATIGSITNIGSVGPSGSMSVSPTQSGAYTATFTGPGGTVNCTVNIQIIINNPPQQNAPTCTLTVSDSTINEGDRLTLSWTSTNANSGSITSLGSVNTNGSQTTYPNQSQSYTGTFTGPGGTANCYASVNVRQNNNHYNSPECTLTANPTIINPGQPVRLSWWSSDANQGTITDLGSVPSNGSQTVYPNYSQTYEGTFTGNDGSVNCFVTVNVNQVYLPPVQQPPYISLSAAPYTGLDLGPWGTAAYWSFLVAWCAFAAYLVGVKRVQNKLFDYVMTILYGTKTLAKKSDKLIYNSANDSKMATVSIAPETDITDNFLLKQITR